MTKGKFTRLSLLSNHYPGINFIIKSRYDDLNESYNKPNTIFLAHVRRMHWVCISNIYLSSNTKNIDKELYGSKVEADPALLALSYAVSIAEERHPAANDFEENELMVQHYNRDMCVLRQTNL
jgi:hypothetical protein